MITLKKDKEIDIEIKALISITEALKPYCPESQLRILEFIISKVKSKMPQTFSYTWQNEQISPQKLGTEVISSNKKE